MVDAGIMELEGKLQGGRIVLNCAEATVKAHIEAGRLAVLSGIWPQDKVMAFRRAIWDWAGRRPPHPFGQSASLPGLSFHRFDDEQTPSILPHVFHQMGLCSETHGDPELWVMASELMCPLLDLQNRLAGMNLDLCEPMLRVKVMNHPVGGGYHVKHVHPLELMKVAFALSLSRPGSDYRAGDVVFDVDGAEVAMEERFALGNAILFRYDLPHAVTPIDPAAPRDWSDQAGLWVAAVEPVGAYLASNRV